MTRSEETLKIGGKAVQLFTGGAGPPLLYLHGAGTYWWMPVHDLGLERVDVVGLSLGGWLAAELALRHPGRVHRLVLVDAAGTRVPGVVREDLFMASPAKARQLLFADPSSALAAELVPDVPAPERLEAALRGREAAARLLWNPHVQYRKLTSRLGRIKAPTLVVWGAQDRVLPLALGETYQRGIPGATLTTIEGCGHLPPLEAPERFAHIVLDFLRR